MGVIALPAYTCMQEVPRLEAVKDARTPWRAHRHSKETMDQSEVRTVAACRSARTSVGKWGRSNKSWPSTNKSWPSTKCRNVALMEQLRGTQKAATYARNGVNLAAGFTRQRSRMALRKWKFSIQRRQMGGDSIE